MANYKALNENEIGPRRNIQSMVRLPESSTTDTAYKPGAYLYRDPVAAVYQKTHEMLPRPVDRNEVDYGTPDDTALQNKKLLDHVREAEDVAKANANAEAATGYETARNAGRIEGLRSAGLSDVINNYWRDYCDAMGRGDWKAISGTVAGAALLGMGAFWAAKKWKEYRRKRAEEDGISLSPELENA